MNTIVKAIVLNLLLLSTAHASIEVMLAKFAWLVSLPFDRPEHHTSAPSPLINQPFPAFELNAVEQADVRITKQDILGRPAIVNVWATWCAECRRELPVLSRLSKQGVLIYGINYKDLDAKAIKEWMTEYEHPYAINMSDKKGTLGLDLGIYGAPETFLIDKQGTIRFNQRGLVTEKNWNEVLAPIYQELLNE